MAFEKVVADEIPILMADAPNEKMQKTIHDYICAPILDMQPKKVEFEEDEELTDSTLEMLNAIAFRTAKLERFAPLLHGSVDILMNSFLSSVRASAFGDKKEMQLLKLSPLLSKVADENLFSQVAIERTIETLSSHPNNTQFLFDLFTCAVIL